VSRPSTSAAVELCRGSTAELAHELDDVAAEPVLVGGWVPGVVDASADAPAKVLDERPEGESPDGPTRNAGSRVSEMGSMRAPCRR
jgi:hypothetical protein